MAKYTLDYSEMAWWLIDNEGDPFYNKKMIGNTRDGIELLRDGPDVLIASNSIGLPKNWIIPSDTVVKGFGPRKDGRPLNMLTDTGNIYNSALLQVA